MSRLAGQRRIVSGAECRPPTRDAADVVAVRDNPERERYEVYVDSALAGYAAYHSQPGLVTVLHTEIDTAFEGRGVGSELVRRMLDDLRHRKVRVLAVCPFVRAYLQRHPEYAELAWRPDEAAP